MKRNKVSATILTAGAVAGLVIPGSAANAAPGGNGGGPSCAAAWAHYFTQYGLPLGQFQKEFAVKGFASYVAREKLMDYGSYCGDSE